MIKINVLSPGFTSPNGSGFLFPLIKFKHIIEEFGYQISIQNKLRKATTNCDILMIDSKYFKHMWSANYTETLEIISNIAKKTTLIWCDQSDSTGTLLGQVLPYVHRYIKAQILKDKSKYTKNHYGSRVYTDYYHKKLGIQDKIPNSPNTVTKEIYLKKIHISWNSGLMNYGWISPYIQQIRNFVPLNNLLFFAKPFNTAEEERPLDISCRMGITYPRETVCYQRRKIRDILKKYVQTDKLSRNAYLKELSNGKVCISPFGFGEITLKDYECFLAGSMLLKPNMDHMETWPNFYKNNITYASHNWELDDLQSTIDYWLTNQDQRIEVARQGQELYINHTIGPQAALHFAKHFNAIVSL